MCECIKRTNDFLAQHNTKIMVPIVGPKLPFVQTVKLDEKKRGKPTYLFATYCPMCGKKFPEAA